VENIVSQYFHKQASPTADQGLEEQHGFPLQASAFGCIHTPLQWKTKLAVLQNLGLPRWRRLWDVLQFVHVQLQLPFSSE